MQKWLNARAVGKKFRKNGRGVGMWVGSGYEESKKASQKASNESTKAFTLIGFASTVTSLANRAWAEPPKKLLFQH